ncbi:hypothetical protein AXFE_15420 [Acidithrix ferrooxidans]|uniref:Uncharacterized protein n=1 Tax=Acidithrix ferrooxidans TaxID=1280514 RepID=A0A0D8HHT2_9ACTN|nr:hypothetical protein AXFE_15420 [Acidithrix ferrooxidans]
MIKHTEFSSDKKLLQQMIYEQVTGPKINNAEVCP